MSTQLDELFRVHQADIANLANQAPVELAGDGLLDLPKRVLTRYWNNPHELLSVIEKSGYKGVCTGMSQFSVTDNSSRFIEYLEKFPSKAFHGSNLKTAQKIGLNYQRLLEKEADLLDLAGEDTWINYDLFSGMLAPTGLNYSETITNYLNITASLLKTKPSLEKCIEALVSAIRKAFPNKKVALEIPGAYGGSGFPPFEPKILALIASLLDDSMHLCIDLGHLLTWCLTETNTVNLELFLQKIELLRPLLPKIGMLHISSAGGYRKEFLQLWEQTYKQKPLWNTPHLDLMLTVDEKEMIEGLRKLRQMLPSAPLEIVESRSYQDFLDDYFPHLVHSDFSNYLKEISVQAQILGYHPDSKIGYGIIGYGHIGERYGKNLKKIRGANWLSTCDTIPRDVKTEPLEQLLANPLIQTVIIATPSGSHEEIAVQAAAAGKHALVEKPIALSEESLIRMMTIFSSKDLKLATVFQNRHAKPIVYLHKVLPDLGKIFLISGVMRWHRDQSYYNNGWRGTKKWDGGVLMNQGIHFIDLIVHLIKKPIYSVYARSKTFHHTMECEDGIVIIMEFQGGALGVLEASTLAANKNIEGSISLQTENASLKIGGTCLNEIVYWEGKAKPSEELDLKDSAINRHEEMLASYNDAIKFKKNTGFVDASEALASLRIIEAAYRSVETNQPIYFI